MQQTCAHMFERAIEHEPSGRSADGDDLGGDRNHTPGDRIVLTCPHGCEDIIIHVVDKIDEKGTR